jgi:hypothetical protein
MEMLCKFRTSARRQGVHSTVPGCSELGLNEVDAVDPHVAHGPPCDE